MVNVSYFDMVSCFNDTDKGKWELMRNAAKAWKEISIKDEHHPSDLHKSFELSKYAFFLSLSNSDFDSAGRYKGDFPELIDLSRYGKFFL